MSLLIVLTLFFCRLSSSTQSMIHLARKKLKAERMKKQNRDGKILKMSKVVQNMGKIHEANSFNRIKSGYVED